MYQYNYEKEIINSLIKIEEKKKRKDVTNIVTELLLEFLNIENQFTRMDPLNKNSIILSTQNICESIHIREIRNKIFDYLTIRISDDKEIVMDYLYNYTYDMRRCRDIKILINDKNKIEKIFEKYFIKNDFEEKILISGYYLFLNDMTIEYDNKILNKILDTELIFYNNLCIYSDSNEFKFFLSEKNFKLELKILIKVIENINNKEKRKSYFNFSYLYELENYLIKKNDIANYLYLLDELFDNNKFNYLFSIDKMVSLLGKEKVYNMINEKKYKYKYKYLYLYNLYLSTINISEVRVKEIIEFYKNATVEELDTNFQIHKNLKKEYPYLLIDTIQILNDRIDKEGLFINYLAIFNGHVWKPKEVIEIFKNNINLIEEIYKKMNSLDHQLLFLYEILEIDFNFLNYFVKNIFLKRSSHLDYTKLKTLPNYFKILKAIVDILLAEDLKYHFLRDLKRLFTDLKEEKIFFEKKIIQNIDNEVQLEKIFTIICEMNEEEKIHYFLFLINKNVDIKILKVISLYPNLEVGIGSRVPYYQEKIELYEKILEELSGLDKRMYRKIVEEKIENLKKYKKNIKLREIIEEY